MNNLNRLGCINLIQRSINGIWEGKIISHIKNEDVLNMEYLNLLTQTLFNIEEAYKPMLKKYNLKITCKNYIQSCKYPGIPRRFEVTGNEVSNAEDKSLHTVCKMYNSNNISFSMVYNAYTEILKIDDIKDYMPMSLDYKKLKVKNIYYLNGETIAAMKDIITDKYYKFNMDKDLLTLANVLNK